MFLMKSCISNWTCPVRGFRVPPVEYHSFRAASILFTEPNGIISLGGIPFNSRHFDEVDSFQTWLIHE
jgi:hypothetical protein